MNASAPARPGGRGAAWVFPAALAAAGLLALLWAAVCTAPGIYWNPPRLAAAFALAHGLNLYPPAESGAQLGWFYPPGFALWYLPVTVFRNPTTIIVAAALLNLLTIVGPLVLLARASLESRSATGVAVFTGLVLWCANATTSAAFFWIHIDAVCVACGLVACLATWRAAHTGAMRWLHLASLAGVMAMLTKQLAVAVPLALAGWLLLGARQPGPALRLLCWTACYGGAAALACLLAWGAEPTLRAIVVLHTRMPAQGGEHVLVRHLLVAGRESLVWGAVAWLAWPRTAPPRPPGPPSLVSLVLVVALVQFPLGLRASLNYAAGLNSFHTLHYLAAAVALAAGRWWETGATLAHAARRRVLLAVLWCAGVGLGHVHAHEHELAWTLDRSQDSLLALAEQHRGRVYFPWNPLITILTDDKIYPFDDALICYDRAGMPVPVSAVQSAIPPHSLILFPKFTQSARVLDYLGPNPSPPGPTGRP